MQWKKLIEPTVWVIWGLVVGGAGLWVIVGSIGYFGKEGWLPDDTAGWVQAIGSIGAILAAIWISGGERRHREKIEKDWRRDSISRGVEASEYARKIVQNTIGLFECESLPRVEIPRFLGVVEAAAVRVKEVSVSPGVDSELLGHLYEVRNALVDVKGLIEQFERSLENRGWFQLDFLKDNAIRIDKAILGLRAINK